MNKTNRKIHTPNVEANQHINKYPSLIIDIDAYCKLNMLYIPGTQPERPKHFLKIIIGYS